MYRPAIKKKKKEEEEEAMAQNKTNEKAVAEKKSKQTQQHKGPEGKMEALERKWKDQKDAKEGIPQFGTFCLIEESRQARARPLPLSETAESASHDSEHLNAPNESDEEEEEAAAGAEKTSKRLSIKLPSFKKKAAGSSSKNTTKGGTHDDSTGPRPKNHGKNAEEEKGDEKIGAKKKKKPSQTSSNHSSQHHQHHHQQQHHEKRTPVHHGKEHHGQAHGHHHESGAAAHHGQAHGHHHESGAAAHHGKEHDGSPHHHQHHHHEKETHVFHDKEEIDLEHPYALHHFYPPQHVYHHHVFQKKQKAGSSHEEDPSQQTMQDRSVKQNKSPKTSHYKSWHDFFAEDFPRQKPKTSPPPTDSDKQPQKREETFDDDEDETFHDQERDEQGHDDEEEEEGHDFTQHDPVAYDQGHGESMNAMKMTPEERDMLMDESISDEGQWEERVGGRVLDSIKGFNPESEVASCVTKWLLVHARESKTQAVTSYESLASEMADVIRSGERKPRPLPAKSATTPERERASSYNKVFLLLGVLLFQAGKWALGEGGSSRDNDENSKKGQVFKRAKNAIISLDFVIRSKDRIKAPVIPTGTDATSQELSSPVKKEPSFKSKQKSAVQSQLVKAVLVASSALKTEKASPSEVSKNKKEWVDTIDLAKGIVSRLASAAVDKDVAVVRFIDFCVWMGYAFLCRIKKSDEKAFVVLCAMLKDRDGNGSGKGALYTLRLLRIWLNDDTDVTRSSSVPGASPGHDLTASLETIGEPVELSDDLESTSPLHQEDKNDGSLLGKNLIKNVKNDSDTGPLPSSHAFAGFHAPSPPHQQAAPVAGRAHACLKGKPKHLLHQQHGIDATANHSIGNRETATTGPIEQQQQKQQQQQKEAAHSSPVCLLLPNGTGNVCFSDEQLAQPSYARQVLVMASHIIAASSPDKYSKSKFLLIIQRPPHEIALAFQEQASSDSALVHAGGDDFDDYEHGGVDESRPLVLDHDATTRASIKPMEKRLALKILHSEIVPSSLYRHEEENIHSISSQGDLVLYSSVTGLDTRIIRNDNRDDVSALSAAAFACSVGCPSYPSLAKPTDFVDIGGSSPLRQRTNQQNPVFATPASSTKAGNNLEDDAELGPEQKSQKAKLFGKPITKSHDYYPVSNEVFDCTPVRFISPTEFRHFVAKIHLSGFDEETPPIKLDVYTYITTTTTTTNPRSF